MKKKDSTLSNTRIAAIFLILISLFLGISLFFKVILVISKGQFADNRRFNFLVSDTKNTQIMSLSSKKDVVIFKVPYIKKEEAGKFLEIPIGGFVESDTLDLNQNLDSLFLKTILSYNKLKTNFTIIDLARIFNHVRAIPKTGINTKDMPLDLPSNEIDKIVGRLASDGAISKEKKTIQIVNGTQISGFGNRLARLVTNLGGDVIIVATSDSIQKKSMISYIGKKTYTVERLTEILGYDTIESSNAIADITIIIGEDKAASSPF